MPALPWWAYLLIKIAINFGVPQLVKIWPAVPQWVLDIINEYLNKLKDPNESNSSAKKMALHKICNGVGCETDIKND